MASHQKTLGVIGGLGPLPTAYLAEMLALYSDVGKDQEHINLLIHSYPSTPDRTEYILGRSDESPLDKIVKTGTELCRLGVDLIAIPCVTSHYFYKEISSAFSVPVVNMLEETAAVLKNMKIKRAGIMATSGTVSTCLFQNTLIKSGIDSVIPDAEYQEDVMYLIYNCVKAGKPIDVNRYKRVSEHLFAKGAEKIILGCTELAVLNRLVVPPENTVCALEVLAKSSLRKLGVKIRQ